MNQIVEKLLNKSADDPDVVLVNAPEIAEYWESEVNIKTIKEFVKKVTGSHTLEEGKVLKVTDHFNEETSQLLIFLLAF